MPAQDTAKKKALNIMSYNIKALGSNYSQPRMEAICDKINQEQQPDVVVFQEVFKDEAEADLKTALADNYTFIESRSGGVLMAVKKPLNIEELSCFQFSYLNNADRLTRIRIPGIRSLSGSGKKGKGGIITTIKDQHGVKQAILLGMHTQAQYPNTSYLEAGILKRYGFFKENREDPKNLAIITLGNVAEAVREANQAQTEQALPIIIAGDINLYLDNEDHTKDGVNFYTSETFGDQKITKQQIYKSICELMLGTPINYQANSLSFNPPDKDTAAPDYFDSVKGEAHGSLDIITVLNQPNCQEEIQVPSEVFVDKKGNPLSDHNPALRQVDPSPQAKTEQSKNGQAAVKALGQFIANLTEQNARIYNCWGMFSAEARIKSTLLDNILCQQIATIFEGQSILQHINEHPEELNKLISQLLTNTVHVNAKGNIVESGTSNAIEVSLLGVLATPRSYRAGKFIDAAAENTRCGISCLEKKGEQTTSLDSVKQVFKALKIKPNAINLTSPNPVSNL